MKLCLPAIVYLVINLFSILFTVYTNDIQFVSTFLSFLFMFVWTYILNLICRSGYTIISWILVMIPFIIFLFILLLGLFGFSQLSAEDKKQVIEETKKEMDKQNV